MASAADLIKEAKDEQIEDDRCLLEFYECNLALLNDIFLKDINFSLLYQIARYLHRTMLDDEIKWIEFLEKLGIIDNNIISDIRHKSKDLTMYPIYYAFRTELKHRKRFGEVIRVIIECNRYDVLRDIKESVNNLLNPKPSAPDYKFVHSCQKCDEEAKPIKPVEKENCALEKNSLDSSNNMSLTKKVINTSQYPNRIAQQLNFDNTIIKALLLNADREAEIAKQLTQLFYEENIIVKTYSDLDILFGSDAIPTILRKVDFVVPIVSDSFMTLIDPLQDGVFPEQENSLNDTYVPYIYKLLSNEFVHFYKSSLNLRVKPFKMPNVRRKDLIYDLLLTNSVILSYQNPDDMQKCVIKLSSILRKTQRLLGGI